MNQNGKKEKKAKIQTEHFIKKERFQGQIFGLATLLLELNFLTSVFSMMSSLSWTMLDKGMHRESPIGGLSNGILPKIKKFRKTDILTRKAFIIKNILFYIRQKVIIHNSERVKGKKSLRIKLLHSSQWGYLLIIFFKFVVQTSLKVKSRARNLQENEKNSI